MMKSIVKIFCLSVVFLAVLIFAEAVVLDVVTDAHSEHIYVCGGIS